MHGSPGFDSKVDSTAACWNTSVSLLLQAERNRQKIVAKRASIHLQLV